MSTRGKAFPVKSARSNYLTARLVLVILGVGWHVAPGPARADQSTWVPVDPLNKSAGNWVSSLVIDPKTPTTIYAAAQFGGIYKSTDAGATWAKSSNGPTGNDFRVLGISSSNPTILYATTSSDSPGMPLSPKGIFKTTDGGLNWKKIDRPSDQYLNLAIHPTDPNIVYAATRESGILKSTDGGVTWSGINPSPGTTVAYAVIISPTDPNTVYLGTNEGLWKSTDGGTSWSTSDQGLPGAVFKVAISASNPGILYALGASAPFDLWFSDAVLYKSTDRGATWTMLGSDAPKYIEDLKTDPTDPNTVFVANLGGLVKTTNGGVTWTKVQSGGSAPFGGSAVVINPSQPSLVYVGGTLGVLKSADQGLVPTTPINAPVSISLTSAVIDSESDFFLGLPGGPALSSDGGTTWTEEELGGGLVHVSTVAILAVGTVLAGTDMGVVKFTGTPLTPGPTSIRDQAVNTLAANPNNANIVLAGTNTGIFRSSDGGIHWTPIPFGNPANAICWGDANTAYAGTQTGGVEKSTDGGATFGASNSGFPNPIPSIDSIAVDPVNPNSVFVGTGSGLFTSQNAGGSWTQSTNLPDTSGVTSILPVTQVMLSVNALSPAVQTNTVLYVGTSSGGVFKSTDGGASWTAFNTGLTNLSVTTLAVDKNGTVYAGTQGAGLFKTVAAAPTPDFSLSLDQQTATAQAGTKARVTVNINRTGGFAGNVTITPPAPQSGIKPKPPDPITTTDPSAAFKLKIAGSTPGGSYQLVFKGVDASGRERDVTLTLVVQ